MRQQMRRKYPCVYCAGTGEGYCPCCGEDKECEQCEGTGIDSDKVDIEAFRSECDRLFTQSSWDYLEDGITAGRCGGDLVGEAQWTVRYDDFLKKGPQ